MINGAELRDFYIDAWRRIPALVEALGGEDTNIRASNGVSRVAQSLQREILEMPVGSIFVAYQGFTRGNVRNSEVTKHEIAVFIRALTPDDDAHIAFGDLMIDSVPDGDELRVRYLEANQNVDSMDLPRFERVSTSELTFDVWKLTISVPEHS